jgi:hypothetical protein
LNFQAATEQRDHVVCILPGGAGLLFALLPPLLLNMLWLGFVASFEAEWLS